MGLINKTVEVTLANQNIKWYEEKGYYIPRTEKIYKNKNGGDSKEYTVTQGTKIIVDVEDLFPNSGVKVDAECDCCKKHYKIQWVKYLHHNYEGKVYCKSCVNKVLNSKEKSCNWNPNKTQEEREKARAYPEYTEFIRKVLMRDNYTCVITGKTIKETELEVHHLNGYNWFIEGRTDVKNAVTITKDLHKAFHGKYGYGNNTKEQFLEFVELGDLKLKDYDLAPMRWMYCVTDNELIKNVSQYSKKNNIDRSSIRKCCNKEQFTCCGKIYMWYDEYINMSNDELKNYIYKCEKSNNHKQVICINTNLLFDSSVCAGKYYGINNSSIVRCINKKQNYAGKSQDGQKLIWNYAYEVDNIKKYTYIPRDKCDKIASLRDKESLKNDSFITYET